MIEKSDLPPSSPFVESHKAKKARQNATIFSTEVSSLAINEDSILAKLKFFANNLDKIN